MGVPNEKLRVITARRRRRLRHENDRLPGIHRAFWWRRARSAARCIGNRRARRPSSATRRRATPSPMSSLRSTIMASFSRLHVRHLCNQGAYVANAGININTNNFARCLPGMYRIPKVDVSVACYFSNRVPIAPYRGAGRPEANYVLERAVEEAARVIGIDPVAPSQEKSHSALGHPLQDARLAIPTTAAIFLALSNRRWNSPTTPISTSANAKRRGARNSAASAFPACWSIPAPPRWNRPRSRFPAATN